MSDERTGRARCPHCGSPDAPTWHGVYERHRRAGWRAGVDPSNELCFATGEPVGQPCRHLAPSPYCVNAIKEADHVG